MQRQVFIHLKTLYKISSLVVLFLFSSCKDSEYSKLVKQEMNRGIVKDSLFLGLKLGDTRKTFYDTCWKLNKNGIITQGPKNSFVQYNLPIKKNDSTAKKIRMLFYGTFNEQKIMTGMDMKFSYDAWALWNKNLQSNQLALVLQDTLLAWFPGNKFIEVELKKIPGKTFIKVDGNRRIIIEPLKDHREVDVRIDNLQYKLD
ncbi:Lipoprotein [Zobellia nedashkovskayae]